MLTEKGKGQCADLCKRFKYHNDINLVVTSPLRRTIQTASLSFGPVLARDDVPFIAVPEAQEVGDHLSDTGTEVEKLKEQLKGGLFQEGELKFDIGKLDLGHVQESEGWTTKVCY